MRVRRSADSARSGAARDVWRRLCMSFSRQNESCCRGAESCGAWGVRREQPLRTRRCWVSARARCWAADPSMVLADRSRSGGWSWGKNWRLPVRAVRERWCCWMTWDDCPDVVPGGDCAARRSWIAPLPGRNRCA
jgi:hypothetical protein